MICFIISSEVKHDTLIYSYCEFNLYVEGLLVCVRVLVRAACVTLTNQLLVLQVSHTEGRRRDGEMEG